MRCQSKIFAKRKRYVTNSPLGKFPLSFVHVGWLNKRFPYSIERREIDVSKITPTLAHHCRIVDGPKSEEEGIGERVQKGGAYVSYLNQQNAAR